MPRRHVPLLAALVLTAFNPVPDAAVRVSGTVVTSQGPVPYAMVTLQPLGAGRFADEQGRFVFPNVPRGRYRALVRQVGYRPLDTAIVVADEPLDLTLTVEPLLLRLDSIVVAVVGPCRRPGPPDSVTSGEAHALLQQLRTSSARYQLLSDSFPFLYDFQRTVRNLSMSDVEVSRVVDTARYRSDRRHSYRPGEMVEWGRGAEFGQRVLRLPTLAHFGDSAFVWSHCWSTPGTVPGDSLVALTFRPAEQLVGADVEGTVFLDADSFQLRAAELRLTHVNQALPSAAAVTTTMRFREEHPGLVVPAEIVGMTRAAPERGIRRRVWTVVEEQRLLGLRYVRARLR